MYTAKDIREMIQERIGSSAYKSELQKLGAVVYTDAEKKRIVDELREAIRQAFFSVVAAHTQLYSTVRKTNNDTYMVIFPADALHRDSLFHETKKGGRKYLGAGVYDIIGLFTQGWSYDYTVYGVWKQPSRMLDKRGVSRRIRGRNNYEGNSFIANVIKDFQFRYPGLDITYPPEWGG